MGRWRPAASPETTRGWHVVKTSVGPVPFKAHLDGRPDVGQGDGWTPREWRRGARKRLVRLTDLIATNRGAYLDERRVDRYVRRSPRALPQVMEHAGFLYIVNGHHRVTAAFRRGEEFVTAEVMTCR
jgi:hypothetical protein